MSLIPVFSPCDGDTPRHPGQAALAAQIRDPSEGSGTLRWIPALRFAPAGMTVRFHGETVGDAAC